MATSEKRSDPSNSYDIIIVGSGLSGINAAYRVQQGLPHLSYTILEARDVIGGTWSFFKYPGIRSDSEISTFAFSWAPWDQDSTIADAASIIQYVENTAKKHGIDKKVQFDTRVGQVEWKSELQRWVVSTTTTGNKTKVFHARFLIMSTGYYNYAEPYRASIPGLDNFKGDVVHPQFWPEDVKYSGKKVVVVGSGATAVTLVPAMAKEARNVTMLQRSPSHYLVMPTHEPIDKLTKRLFSEEMAYALIRIRILVVSFLFVQFCYLFPKAAAKLLLSGVKAELPENYPLDPHFKPTYPPFEQRLCITPDGDFFHAIKDGKANVVTGEIESMEDRAIVLKSGQKIEDVDVIVTATGLKLHVIGGIKPLIDGEPVDISSKYTWRSTCLQDVPNLCFMLGYIDNAWTLGTDSSSRLFVRLIQTLEKKGCTSFVPSLTEKEQNDLVEVPMVNMSSGYIERSKTMIPRTASLNPWRPRWHYFGDYWFAGWGSVEKGMKMIRVPS